MVKYNIRASYKDGARLYQMKQIMSKTEHIALKWTYYVKKKIGILKLRSTKCIIHSLYLGNG